MSTAPSHTNVGNGVTSPHDLFALTDEQILQIEPDAQDLEVFAGERSDRMDPLREDLELLTSNAQSSSTDSAARSNGKGADDGLKAVATNANATDVNSTSVNATTKTSQSADASAKSAA